MRGNIGIIAEDNSDVDSIKIFIYLISKKKIGCKPFIGKGCGKIARKCHTWANQLLIRGCSILIVVHDSDNNDPLSLHKLIKDSLSPSPIKKYIISIPIQELETWLLSDPSAIKKALNLRKEPKTTGRLEDINSPKEYLGEIIYKASDKKKPYVNTIHNDKIVTNIDIKKILQKCPSFKPFYDFVKLNIT